MTDTVRGSLKYCVKWESAVSKITAAERAELSKELNTKVNKWIEVLAGYDGWPYPKVDVKITGWAANDTKMLDGFNAETEGLKLHGDACPKACARYSHRNGVYTGCPGGNEGHHDMSLILKDSIKGGGSGQDWGCNLGSGDILKELKRTDPDRMHIYLHETV